MRIPLSPLRTVLFPGMSLPLRIFEERYRVMISELLESGGVFGVVLIREGQEVGGGAVPYDVGTLARIESCTETGRGHFSITARGVQRFRLLRMLDPRPYPHGEITPIEDSLPYASRQLDTALETVRATFPVYFRLALSLTDQWARGLKLPADPHQMVDFIGPWLQADEETRQRLLEPETAAERVAQLAEIIDDLLSRTREEALEHRRRKFEGPGAQN
ncbi:MAG: LON peptidase substrate-binding domain-containing protein [Dehalococcoidia bacterium]|nr:LON peptidase substrate-binding domain-containing protein [Dehalococcoidia bacterium]